MREHCGDGSSSSPTYLKQVLFPELRAGDIVILDNLSTHKTDTVATLISASN